MFNQLVQEAKLCGELRDHQRSDGQLLKGPSTIPLEVKLGGILYMLRLGCGFQAGPAFKVPRGGGHEASELMGVTSIKDASHNTACTRHMVTGQVQGCVSPAQASDAVTVRYRVLETAPPQLASQFLRAFSGLPVAKR